MNWEGLQMHKTEEERELNKYRNKNRKLGRTKPQVQQQERPVLQEEDSCMCLCVWERESKPILISVHALKEINKLNHAKYT